MTRLAWLLSPRFVMVAVALVAFALRVWQLEAAPPGWRDDELIETLVISQKVLDGDWAFYYPDASGHEALYHFLHAAVLRLVGLNVFGIRLLSVVAGTLAAPFTYVLGRRLFGPWLGVLAAAGLALSFWSLMYSRFGLRHILTPLLMLGAFYFFWRGLGGGRRPGASYLIAALFLGLGFYTYFAARGVPLILAAFCGYLWLFYRPLFRRQWQRFLLMFLLAALLAVPLVVTLARQPESEARVAELAIPIVAARQGDFGPLRHYTLTTLSMFHADGDDEWLYNIPHRPIFNSTGALLFWSGVAIALYYTLHPLISTFKSKVTRRKSSPPKVPFHPLSPSSAFLLLWWTAGITPGFLSVPPASLGHTILAQPAVFILAALPIWYLTTLRWPAIGGSSAARRWLPVALALVLLAGMAWRDLPDYFQVWPARGMVRFLYRADLKDVADYLNQRPALEDFGITGLLAGPWDRLALAIDLDQARAATVRPRWYNPERAILLEPALSFSGFPAVPFAFPDAHRPLGEGGAGGYALGWVEVEWEPAEATCFANGLCWRWAAYEAGTQRLTLGWQALRRLDLPDMPLISNPPPPGVYAGPRLLVFAQLQDAAGNFLAGDDGLWVDPATLYPGDTFLQQHWLAAPAGTTPATAVFGLYDPMTGQRILSEDGRDHLRLPLGE